MTFDQKKVLSKALGLGALLFAVSVRASDWTCPDAGNDLHHREVLATSAPEIKVRTAVQDDSATWAKTLKPLTTKAIRLAKDERSKAIQEGIEHTCGAPQIYMAQMVNASDTPSGCEHKIVTRPADPDHMWVQVVATCKFDWSCCSPKGAGKTGFLLEGPLGGNTPAESTSTAKPSKH